jgi:signal recognition particle receptor subunit alpha
LSGALKDIEVEEADDDYDYEETNNKSNKSKNTTNGKKQTTAASSSNSGFFSSLKGLVGGKTLTKESMASVMEKMQEHLVAKNVAAEIAAKVCDNVLQNLEGKQLSSFQFVTTTIKQALHESMVQILTPKKRIDILRDVYEAQRTKRPYVIVFCGVNGVGKSTNLAKVTFWLIENSFRVLIAACDTFRSGAVEQLRTHTRHLNALHPPEAHNGKQMVELFEKGYGKDSASIAHDAISHGMFYTLIFMIKLTLNKLQFNF